MRCSAACGPSSTPSSTPRSSWCRSWRTCWSRPSSCSSGINSASARNCRPPWSWYSVSGSSATPPPSAGTSSRPDPGAMTHRPTNPPADPEPTTRGPGGRTSTGTKMVVAVLCALLGFGVALQFRRTASGDALASVRPDDLVQILDGLQRREDDLGEEISALTDTLSRLRSAGDSSAAALAEAQRRAEALGILTGTAAAAGPG